MQTEAVLSISSGKVWSSFYWSFMKCSSFSSLEIICFSNFFSSNMGTIRLKQFHFSIKPWQNFKVIPHHLQIGSYKVRFLCITRYTTLVKTHIFLIKGTISLNRISWKMFISFGQFINTSRQNKNNNNYAIHICSKIATKNTNISLFQSSLWKLIEVYLLLDFDTK